jgi:GNAT superfamily N-acetyltransferase
VARVSYETWRLFAPFHYLTSDLHRAARCFGLFVDDRIAAFAGMLHRPHALVDDIEGCSRLVTLPDFQGLGLAMALIDQLGASYRALGKRVRTYPAHPSLIRSFDKSSTWSLVKRPGRFENHNQTKVRPEGARTFSQIGRMGGRPCAVFEYIGAAASDRRLAEQLIHA